MSKFSGSISGTATGTTYLAQLVITDDKGNTITSEKAQFTTDSSAEYGEINFTIEKKREAMEAVKAACIAEEKPERVLDFDGYRVEFADWWFNIRPSNTEPYLRLIMEARTESLLKEKRTFIEHILESYII